MSDNTPQFDADTVASGVVSKDGALATIEFVAGEQRLWVTLPVASLAPLAKLATELDALRWDAKNGVASKWYVDAVTDE